jgi:hypothetical protein
MRDIFLICWLLYSDDDRRYREYFDGCEIVSWSSKRSLQYHKSWNVYKFYLFCVIIIPISDIYDLKMDIYIYNISICRYDNFSINYESVCCDLYLFSWKYSFFYCWLTDDYCFYFFSFCQCVIKKGGAHFSSCSI